MTKAKKIICGVLAAVFVLTVSVCSVIAYRYKKLEKYSTQIIPITEEQYNLPKQEIAACYAYDILDPTKLIGAHDYVFIAKVNDIKGVKYFDTHIEEDGSISGIPHTYFEVEVVKNIKDELVTNEPILIRGLGGPSADGKSWTIPQVAQNIEKGCYYTFVCNADATGELYFTDCSIVNMGTGNLQDSIKQASAYYEEIIKKQDLSVRKLSGEHFVAAYSATGRLAK